MEIQNLLLKSPNSKHFQHLTFRPYSPSKEFLETGEPRCFSDLEILADAVSLSSSTSETSSDHSNDTFNSATQISLSTLYTVKRRQTDTDYDNPNVKPKRKRANSYQLKVLKETFQQTPFPSSEARRKLAQELGMTPRSVQIWFQNQRQLMRGLGGYKSKVDD